jgi:hypothetical protein
MKNKLPVAPGTAGQIGGHWTRDPKSGKAYQLPPARTVLNRKKETDEQRQRSNADLES